MPDIKTAMTNALKGSGLKLKPQMHRLWDWVKDHPDCLAKDAQSHLQMPSATTLLSALQRRKMVVATKVPKYKNSRRMVLRFRVAAEMHGEYELLPMVLDVLRKPKPETPKREAWTEMSPLARDPAAAKAWGTGPTKPLTEGLIGPKISPQKLDVSTLPLGEAFKLYKELKTYFGDIT